MHLDRPAARRRGFTLLEMAVVLSILIVLSGLIIAKLDVFEMKANKATSAVSMGAINELVQVYRANTTNYPDRWDSLMVANGTAYSLPAANLGTGLKGLHPELTGGLNSQVGTKEIIAQQLTREQQISLGRLGIDTLYDFDAPTTWGFPGDAAVDGQAGANAATLKRSLSVDGFSGGSPTAKATVAFLNYGTRDANGNFTAAGDPTGKANTIVSYIYPGQKKTDTSATPATLNGNITVPPPGKSLVVFGLGPLNTMIGTGGNQALFTDAPFYSNENQQIYYNRYLVVFEVSDDGSRARQVAVLGSDGDPQRDEVSDYYTGG